MSKFLAVPILAAFFLLSRAHAQAVLCQGLLLPKTAAQAEATVLQQFAELVLTLESSESSLMRSILKTEVSGKREQLLTQYSDEQINLAVAQARKKQLTHNKSKVKNPKQESQKKITRQDPKEWESKIVMDPEQDIDKNLDSHSFTLSPDGRFMIGKAVFSHKLYVLDLEKRILVGEQEIPQRVGTISFDATGTRLINENASDFPLQLYKFDPNTGAMSEQPIAEIAGAKVLGKTPWLGSSGRFLVETSKQLKIFDLDGKEISTVNRAVSENELIFDAVYVEARNSLVLMLNDQKRGKAWNDYLGQLVIEEINLKTGKVLAEMETEQKRILLDSFEGNGQGMPNYQLVADQKYPYLYLGRRYGSQLVVIRTLDYQVENVIDFKDQSSTGGFQRPVVMLENGYVAVSDSVNRLTLLALENGSVERLELKIPGSDTLDFHFSMTSNGSRGVMYFPGNGNYQSKVIVLENPKQTK